MAVKAGVQAKNLKQVQKSFAQFNNSLGKTKEPFKKAGTWAVDLIISKTTKGTDYKGNPFKNYTKKYADDKGRTKVDLVKSGKMLGAISFQAFTKKLRIYVKKKIILIVKLILMSWQWFIISAQRQVGNIKQKYQVVNLWD